MARSYTVPKDLLKALNFLNGKRVASISARQFPVYEPRTGELLCECEAAETGTVNEAVESGRTAFANGSWSSLTGFERGKPLKTAALLIRENLEDIAYWEVKDNGKPIWEARVDIAGCADTFDYYGGVAAAVTGDHIPLSGTGRFAYTVREPLGVVAGIGAWNYPFQTASWKIGPALAAGNAFVYKPSPLAPVTAVILADILTHSGVPSGIVNVIQGDKETGEALCLHKDVAKVSFTGSIATGQAIMRACATRGLKPVTLELGGKSPLIIFDDANLDSAVIGAMLANFLTQGEVCTNASRVFVHRSLVEPFTSKLLEATKRMSIGDPLLDETRVGATISREHLQKVAGFIERAKEQGARVLYGGDIIHLSGRLKNGYYMSPCILSDLQDCMDIVREEVFGAVLLILPFDTDSEAVDRANGTPYGLAAGLFTRNLKRAHETAAQLRAGTVYVNTYNDVDVAVPFGGQKMSGLGRENGLVPLEQHYTQLKSVFVDTNDRLESPFG